MNIFNILQPAQGLKSVHTRTTDVTVDIGIIAPPGQGRFSGISFNTL